MPPEQAQPAPPNLPSHCCLLHTLQRKLAASPVFFPSAPSSITFPLFCLCTVPPGPFCSLGCAHAFPRPALPPPPPPVSPEAPARSSSFSALNSELLLAVACVGLGTQPPAASVTLVLPHALREQCPLRGPRTWVPLGAHIGVLALELSKSCLLKTHTHIHLRLS